MIDLFETSCPCCGRAYEKPAPVGFDRFWAAVPAKVGKEASRKAWKRMDQQERAMAAEMVKPFYAWFKREYPDASLLHPSTYLNAKRWEDEAIKPSEPNQDAISELRKGLLHHVPAVREHARATLERMGLQ